MRPRPRPDFTDRGPPHDLDAEKAVLGCLIVSPSLMDGMAQRLVEADFYDVRHKAIWRAMMRLHRKRTPLDMTLLVGALRDAGDYGHEHDQANSYFLAMLYRLYPSVCLIDFYLARVKEMSRRRHALERGEQLIRAAFGQQNNSTSPTAHRRAGKVIA